MQPSCLFKSLRQEGNNAREITVMLTDKQRGWLPPPPHHTPMLNDSTLRLSSDYIQNSSSVSNSNVIIIILQNDPKTCHATAEFSFIYTKSRHEGQIAP